MRTLGESARAARLVLGLTQEEVGERLELSGEFYARIERGHALPSVATLYRLSVILDTRVDTLLGLTRDGTSWPVAVWLKSSGPPRPEDLLGKDPELLRIANRLRRASPSLLRLVTLLLKHLEGPASRRDSDDYRDDNDDGDDRGGR